jgi:hypothetical protein
MIPRPFVVAFGVTEWLAWYGHGLVVALIATGLLHRANRRAGTMAFRIVTWSLVGGVGVGSAILWIVDASGLSYDGVDALLYLSTLASIPAFAVIALAVIVLRIFFRHGSEALERLPWFAVSICVLVIGAACGWNVIGR